MVAKLDSNGGTVDCTLAMDQGHCVGSKSGEDYWTAQDLGKLIATTNRQTFGWVDLKDFSSELEEPNRTGLFQIYFWIHWPDNLFRNWCG